MIKKLAAAVAAFALVGSGVLVAQPAEAASAPTMTYAEFKASPGFAALNEKNVASNALILASPAVQTQTTLQSDSNGFHYMFSMGITSDATKSSAYMMLGTSLSDPINYEVYYTGKEYISSITAVQVLQGNIKNLSAALATLRNPNATAVSSTQPLDGMPDTNPAKLYSAQPQDPLSSVSLDKLAMKFSAVDCQPSATEPTTTECSFAASVFAVAMGRTVTVDFTMDYDAAGLQTNSTIAESVDGIGTVLSITSRQTLLESYTQILPISQLTVDLAAVTKASNRISATQNADAKTTLIAAKAKTSAKKAKKPVDVSDLTAAAKALKLKVKNVPHGVKFTSSWFGQSSSMCVTAVGGQLHKRAC